MTRPANTEPTATHDAVSHLTPEYWQRANRQLVRKILAEFAHERLITPEPAASGTYIVRSDDGASEYRFAARLLALNHWQVDTASITRVRNGEQLPPDAVDLILDLRHTLELTEQVLPVYLEEINSTLASSAFKLSGQRLGAAELSRAGFQQIEAAMTEGHPCFVANSGRIGIDTAEYHTYAPEAAPAVRLVWLAAHRDRCEFTASADLDYRHLIHTELDEATLARFADRMAQLGLDPDDYRLIPVHPWQWWNKLSVTFAGEVAQQRLVYLGAGDDEHQPQQSIRTLFNATAPKRHYVKTAMSVLNMGFLRGLSAEYMRATPAINDWLADKIASDDTLRATGFTILRERAAIGYHHDQYTAATSKGSPYLKMLAALWRESPVPKLASGERLATMASLLHIDADGKPLVGALIAQSGLTPRQWLRRYLEVYLRPLLHCFYAHELVFMPHGENVILVLRDGVPVRVFMKDIAEEIAVLSAHAQLPEQVERIRAEVPDELRPLSILTDVFDCVLRFLNAILHENQLLDQEEFWGAVAECVTDYQESMPHLADRFARDDLFVARFGLSCLNRLQLRDNQQMVDIQDPASAIRLVGELDNPIAEYARAGG